MAENEISLHASKENENRMVQTFLNKVNWKLNTGEIGGCSEFTVDVCRFIFTPSLSKDMSEEFIAYMKTLSMTELRSVMKIWIWLYQHGVKFKLRFSYRRELPFIYNMRHILRPEKIDVSLKVCTHEALMAYTLDDKEREG